MLIALIVATGIALVTQDQVALRAMPNDAAPTQAQLFAGDSLEVRGARLDYLQVWDHRRERGGYVRASQGELTHQIGVADVLFFRADDKYTVVQTAAGEHLIRTSIAELVSQLDSQQFWQVHRSTLVNLNHVSGTRRDELSRLFVRMRGFDGELPVSRAYVHLFKAM